MCPASKSLEADEMLKYKNSQEKLIINQAKMENYHCFALSETVKPSDLGDQGSGGGNTESSRTLGGTDISIQCEFNLH